MGPEKERKPERKTKTIFKITHVKAGGDKLGKPSMPVLLQICSFYHPPKGAVWFLRMTYVLKVWEMTQDWLVPLLKSNQAIKFPKGGK